MPTRKITIFAPTWKKFTPPAKTPKKDMPSMATTWTTSASRIRTNPRRRISLRSTIQRNSSHLPVTVPVRIKAAVAVPISSAGIAVATAAAIVGAADVGDAEAVAVVADAQVPRVEEICPHQNTLHRRAVNAIRAVTISAAALTSAVLAETSAAAGRKAAVAVTASQAPRQVLRAPWKTRFSFPANRLRSSAIGQSQPPLLLRSKKKLKDHRRKLQMIFSRAVRCFRVPLPDRAVRVVLCRPGS